MVDYIYYHGKEPWSNVNEGWADSMCRLTHENSSIAIKDRTIVGTFDKIEHMPITKLAG